MKTTIEWTDYTFNTHWGCVKVSPGCEHCYAESLSSRYGHNIWGPAKTTDRRLFGEKHWHDLDLWNATAARAGQPAFVFCNSMSDLFEPHPALPAVRAKLFERIPHLEWLVFLLLTKRPENFEQMLPKWWLAAPPSNVWLGTSVEDQQRANERIPHLLKCSAAKHFLSVEPLLGPVSLTTIKPDASEPTLLFPLAGEFIGDGMNEPLPIKGGKVDWVIVGGESGPSARRMLPSWARWLRDQCVAAGTAFNFKQWGEWYPLEAYDSQNKEIGIYWQKVGKKKAGRILDGRTWDERPQAVLA